MTCMCVCVCVCVCVRPQPMVAGNHPLLGGAKKPRHRGGLSPRAANDLLSTAGGSLEPWKAGWKDGEGESHLPPASSARSRDERSLTSTTSHSSGSKGA
jgi:hypothetical protein